MAGTKKADGAPIRGKDGRYKGRRVPAKSEPTKSSVPEERKEQTTERPLRPSQCRVFLRRELAHSFRGIVRGFVKQAESGSVQHLKLTTELLDAPGPKRKGKGSAQILLEKLERMGYEDMTEDADAVIKTEDVWPE